MNLWWKRPTQLNLQSLQSLPFLSQEPDSFIAAFFMDAKIPFILLWATVAFDFTEGISKWLFTTILL